MNATQMKTDMQNNTESKNHDKYRAQAKRRNKTVQNKRAMTTKRLSLKNLRLGTSQKVIVVGVEELENCVKVGVGS